VKRPLSDLQVAALRRAATSPDQWIRSVSAGDRVTFASLEARGYFVRRAWRGDGISRDSAFEYQLAPALRAEIERRRRVIEGTLTARRQAADDLQRAIEEGDEQRDYAEERFNEQLMREE